MTAGFDADEVPAAPRILMVAPQPFFQDRGTPIALRQVLEALAAAGYRVDLLTFPIGRDVPITGVRHQRIGNPLRFHDVPIGLSARKLFLDLLLARAMWRALRTNRYAAIHAVEEAGFLAAWMGRRRNVPLVYDMQSSLPAQLAQHRFLASGPARAVAAACERWLLRRAALVVCSAGLSGHVRQVTPGVPVREWQFVPLAVPDTASSDAARLRTEFGIRMHDPVVLYCGNFESYQGVDLLIRAASVVSERHPRVRFVLVGGTWESAPAPPEELARLRDAGTLVIVERRRREDMPAFLAMADVLVSPRCYGDNAPLKVFDYLRASRPIVATDIAAHRPILAEGRSVLVPADVEGLVAGLTRVLADPELATALRRTAQQYADEHLGFDGFVESVREWYASVLSDGPAGTPPSLPAQPVTPALDARG